MKKYLLVLLCCCPSLLQSTTVIIESERKITSYSVQLLYDLYEQSPDYIITKEVHENLPYFKQMMRSYIKDLSLVIEQQDDLVTKSVAKGVAKLTSSLGMLGGGSWMIHKANMFEKSNYKDDRVFMYGVGGIASISVGIISLLASIGHLINTSELKQKLARRYEVGKRILEQLEQTDNTVYQ